MLDSSIGKKMANFFLATYYNKQVYFSTSTLTDSASREETESNIPVPIFSSVLKISLNYNSEFKKYFSIASFSSLSTNDRKADAISVSGRI